MLCKCFRKGNSRAPWPSPVLSLSQFSQLSWALRCYTRDRHLGSQQICILILQSVYLSAFGELRFDLVVVLRMFGTTRLFFPICKTKIKLCASACCLVCINLLKDRSKLLKEGCWACSEAEGQGARAQGHLSLIPGPCRCRWEVPGKAQHTQLPCPRSSAAAVPGKGLALGRLHSSRQVWGMVWDLGQAGTICNNIFHVPALF